MIHCCLDLELEQPRSNPQTPDSRLLGESEIIQVGYVIYSLNPFTVIDTSCEHVDIGVPLSAFIKQLTGITDDDITRGTTLGAIYDELVEKQKKYAFSRVIKQWGSGDVETIKNLIAKDLWAFGNSGCNIKHMYQVYAEANGKNTSGGLAKSMSRCGITWDNRYGHKHNALADAYNTAKMHDFLYRQFTIK